MRRYVRLTDLENEDQREPKAKKRHSDNRISNIATLNNDTMVEAFKYLNYGGLAKTSLVSKRFRDLIQIHRHNLALLFVISIGMKNHDIDPGVIKIFDKELSPEEYNEWATRNNYSKQIPVESHSAGMQSTQYERNFYEIRAKYDIKDPTIAFYARVELTHENWPVFQHFVRLLTSPFIFIVVVQMIPRNEILNLLGATIDPNHDRLQCGVLFLTLNNSSPRKNIARHVTWAKNHVLCKTVQINDLSDSYIDEQLLDLFVTDTETIIQTKSDLSHVIVNFVQKFMDLKSYDENQMIGVMKGRFDSMFSVFAEKFERYAKCIVKEIVNDKYNEQVFELTNDDIQKKMKLRVDLIYQSPEI